VGLTRWTVAEGAIAAMLATSAASFEDKGHAAQGVIPTGAAAPTPATQLAVTEQLMYSTVRITSESNGQQRWGTGFLFNLFKTASVSVTVIVTNHHVVDGLDSCFFYMATKKSDGSPDLNDHIRVEIPNLQSRYFKHPDADLVAIFIAPEINALQAQKKNPFLITLDESLIMSKKDLDDLLPVEQILTLGYPGMLWDSAHNLPVFHRGYTASPCYIPFNGKP
jgi:hypothetical protein